LAESKFEAHEESLGSLLTERIQYVVPSHQRDFSWTLDQIADFLTDIQTAQEAKLNEYFIGLMVFMKGEKNKLVILDGQQRLATTIIILSTVCKKLEELQYHKDANQIQSEFMSFRRLGGKGEESRLIMNDNNKAMFSKYVLIGCQKEDVKKALGVLSKYDPNRRLLEAIVLCKDKIDEIASLSTNDDEVANKLIDFVNYLLENVKLVSFTVSSEANAYTMFETLNDRGLDLSILDLVKNRLFSLAKTSEHLKEVQHTWTQVMTHLSSVRADDFLKAFWTSRHGLVSKTLLFDDFKSKITSWEHARTVSNDMLVAAEQYSGLENADDPVWANLSEEAKKRVRALKIMSAAQIHTILLAALVRFNPNELEKLLKLLEVFTARYQLIGSGRTGTLEVTSGKIAKGIFDKKIRAANDVFVEFQGIYPTDELFKVNFQDKIETNGRKIRYILYKLEMAARAREKQAMGLELEPNNSLTIEHILPKNPGNQWESVLKPDSTIVDECLYRLGNLTLLTKINRSLGNKSFEKKKEVFKQSDLILTRKIADFKEWNRKSIDNRQVYMSHLALEAWSYQ